MSTGTPPGGAIILGKLDGIVVAVGLGVGLVDASTMMLVPMTKDVALSVAVAVRDAIGDAELVTVGLTGMGMDAESLSVRVLVGTSDVGGCVETADEAGTTEETALPAEVGAALEVALAEAVGSNVGAALLGEPVDEGPSDAGTLRVCADEEMETDADVPIAPVPEGVMPELTEPVGRMLPESVAEGVVLAVPESVGTEEERASEAGMPEDGKTLEETAPVGTEPVGGSIPDDGTMPEERGRPDDKTAVEDSSPEDGTTPVGTTPEDGKIPEESTLEGNTVGIMTGAVPVAVGSADKMLDSALGTSDAGRLETTDESSEETSGGRIPDALPVGVAVGAVRCTSVPEGETPGSSDRTDDKIAGRPPELVATDSEVGIAPELRREAVGVALEAPVEPVPRAVVIPTTMPDVGRSGVPLEAEASAVVGRSTLLGRSPVGPTTAVGRAEDNRLSTRPPDEVGCKMLSGGGRRPVVPITAVGRAEDSNSGIKPPVEVGCKMLSGGGRRPVVPITAVGRAEDSNSGIKPPVEVGCKMLSGGGSRPVVPITGVGTGAISDDSRSGIKPPGSVEVGVGVGVESLPLDPGTMKGPRKLDDSRGTGTTEESGATGDDVGRITGTGRMPVDPITGSRTDGRSPPAGSEGTGASVGFTIDDGRTPVGAAGDDVGRITGTGRMPVDPTTGSRIEGRSPPAGSEGTGASVGFTIDDGRTPVGAAGDDVGRITGTGRIPVDPIAGSRIGGRSPPAGSEVGITTGDSTVVDGCAAAEEDVGCTMISGGGPAEGAAELGTTGVEVGVLSTGADDAGRMTGGSRPVGAAC